MSDWLRAKRSELVFDATQVKKSVKALRDECADRAGYAALGDDWFFRVHYDAQKKLDQMIEDIDQLISTF